jgi:hypothetical protein
MSCGPSSTTQPSLRQQIIWRRWPPLSRPFLLEVLWKLFNISTVPPPPPSTSVLMTPAEDFPLWLEVEGIVDWVKEYVTRKSIPFPPPAAETPEVPPCSPGDEEDESKTGPGEEEEHDEQEGDASSSQQQEAEEEQGQSESDLFEMYGGMYRTAIEMILDESRHGV